MMTFKQYLLERTAIFEGYGYYDDRIKDAKSREKEIISALNKSNKFPWILDPASAKFDKQGIDGFIGKNKDGSKTAKVYRVQIKERVSGDDILLELVKPWRGTTEDGLTGRDMKQEIDLYIIVNRSNLARLIKGEVLKDAAVKSYEEFVRGYNTNGNHTQNTKYGEVKIVTDPSPQTTYHNFDKVQKVVTFIRPNSISSVPIQL